MNTGILMEGVFGTTINLLKLIFTFFLEPPAIYFTGLALVGAIFSVVSTRFLGRR